jgi:predicted transcriptional regulator
MGTKVRCRHIRLWPTLATMKTRTELIRALVEPELQAQLHRAAQEQDRSLSYTVHEILAAWAQRQQRQQDQEAAEARRGG